MPALDREVRLPSLARDEALCVRYRRDSGQFVLSLAEADLLQGWASQSLFGRVLARWWPCALKYWRQRTTQPDGEPLTLEHFFRDFDLAAIAHLRWALYYLLVHRPDPEATGLAQWRGYLAAFHHLTALSAWDEAGLLLTLKPPGSDRPLHAQLRAGGYWAEALALYEPLLGRVEASLETCCLAGLSEIHAKLDDYARAIEYSQRYLALPRQAGRGDELIGVLYSLATSCEAIADYPQALEAWQQYLVACRTQGQAAIAALPALLALGRLYTQQAEPARAFDYWQQAIALASEQQRAPECAIAQIGLGRCQYELGDFGAAIATLQACLADSEALANEDLSGVSLARAHLYLGGSFWALGDFTAAIAQLPHCLEQANQLSDDLVLVLFFLGSTHYGRGEYPAAIAYLEQYQQQADLNQTAPAIAQRSLWELGRAHYTLNNPRAAISALQRYLELVEAAGEPQDLHQTFLLLGCAYSAEQDYPAAIEALQQFLNLLPPEPVAADLQIAYLTLGEAYLAQQAFALAIRHLDQFVVLAPQAAAGYFALGKAHCGAGNWATAIANLQAYQQYAERPAPGAWFYLGYARHATGDWAQSEADLQRYCQAPDDQTSTWELAEAYYCLGDLAYQQHDYARAADYWQRFLQRWAAAGRGSAPFESTLESLEATAPAWVARDPWQEPVPTAPLPLGDRRRAALLKLGRAYAQLGEFDRATICWQELLNQTEQPAERGAALFELGGAREILGRYEEAIAAYQEALACADRCQDAAGTGRATGRIGMVHYYRGEYERALSLLHKYLRVARQAGDRWLEGAVFNDLGRVYAAQGDSDRAVSLHQQALNLAREVDHALGEAAARAGLGAAYGNLGNYTQAVKHLQQGLAIAREVQARLLQCDIYFQLGRNQTALAEYPAARESLQAALGLARSLQARRLEALVLGASARLYEALGEYEAGQQDCELAQAIAQELGLPEAEAYAALHQELTPSVLAVLWELLRSLMPRQILPARLSAAPNSEL